MKRRQDHAPRTLTLAEICEAIATGQVPSKVEDGYYAVQQRDLRQLTPPADRRAVLTTARPTGIAS